MEYSPATKRNGTPMHATTRVKPENTVPKGRSQTRKATYCMTAFTWNVQGRQIYRQKGDTVCQGLEGGGNGG